MTATSAVHSSTAALLRAGTRDAHEAAEREPFAVALVAGRLPLAAYTALAAQHLAIYAALERRAEQQRGDRLVTAVDHPALARTPALGRDLQELLGDGWQQRADALVVDATRRYVARIDAADPVRLVAHHYVRHLGDLAGGQVVRRAVLAAYGAGTPVAFYDHAALGPVKPFRDGYRAALDALPLDAAGRARLVDEAVLAFECNRDVFAALGAVHG